MLLFNTSDKTYIGISEYLESIEDDSGNIYRLLMLFNLDSLFEDVKKRSAWRGRYAKDNQGKSLLETIAITDDERDMFDDLMKSGSAEVYRAASAWGKDIPGAFRFNVKFGDPVTSGDVTSGGSTAVLTDTAQTLAVNGLADYKLVITTPGLAMNQERTILSNTGNTITLESAFDVDVTGMDYAVMAQTDDFIIFYLDMSLEWDLNMLMAASEAIREAMVTFFVKEWYLVNRYMDDAALETARFDNAILKIKRALSQRKTPLRRSGEIFS